MTTKEVLNSFTKEEGIRLFNSTKTDKEVYNLLVKKGLTDSFEVYLEQAKIIANKKLSSMSKEELLSQMEGAELTDAQLESIAGGCGSKEKEEGMLIGVGIMGGVAVIATGSVAAAIAG